MQLGAALKAGPAAHGWKRYQRWTVVRVADLIEWLFGVPYTLRGVSYLLYRSLGRDEGAIAEWRTTTWAKVRG